MRIWDIDAGFLNDKSLLGEHRELHGIVSVIKNKKTGYSRHPETLRWIGHLKSLIVRHELLVEEMALRGFNHYSPLKEEGELIWPPAFIDEPGRQYKILEAKYKNKERGRIPLPRNIQELWASHKYSVMARSPNVYKEIGAIVARGAISFSKLSEELVQILRVPPGAGRLENALLHMWGYVSSFSKEKLNKKDACLLLKETSGLATLHQVGYLLHSTALGELRYWCKLIKT